MRCTAAHTGVDETTTLIMRAWSILCLNSLKAMSRVILILEFISFLVILGDCFIFHAPNKFIETNIEAGYRTKMHKNGSPDTSIKLLFLATEAIGSILNAILSLKDDRNIQLYDETMILSRDEVFRKLRKDYEAIFWITGKRLALTSTEIYN